MIFHISKSPKKHAVIGFFIINIKKVHRGIDEKCIVVLRQ